MTDTPKDQAGAFLRPAVARSNPKPLIPLFGVFAVAAGKAANLVGERPMPLIARFERLAYPMLGEVTNRAVLGRKRHGRPGHRLRVSSGGNDLGGKQTRRPEDYRMTAAAKYQAAQKSLSGTMWQRRPSANVWKADVAGEETGKHPVSHRGTGPGIRGKICRDNAGKDLDAAGAHSNLQ
jgi:hypothetical protein